MPTQKPQSRCRYPQCPVKLPTPGKCPKHRSEFEKERRGKEPWRDYGKQWQEIRLKVLQEQPQCINCSEQATEVDHILPLRLGGTHERKNLQSMCKRCHSFKTYTETLKK